MTNSEETVRDKLGDPAGWPHVPDGFFPPNESYFMAKLASVVPDGQDVIIVIEVGGELYQNILVRDSESEAHLICTRVQQKVGQLLLEALNEKLSR